MEHLPMQRYVKKKRPLSAPKHYLELSLGERLFAMYFCIEIKANKNGALNFLSSVLCLWNSDTHANFKMNVAEDI